MTDTILVIAILVFGLWLAWHAVKSLLISARTKSRVPKDVSAMGIPVPPEQIPYVHELSILGFERLGEAQLNFPTRIKPKTSWIFINSDYTIMAELVYPLVGFSSYFGDTWHEMTIYPTGERIRTKNFVVDFVETSIQAAYKAHRQRLQDVPLEFGTPTQLISIDDYIRLNIIWRRKLGSRLLRRFILLDIAIIGAALYSLALILFAALYSDWLEFLEMGIFPSLRPLLIRLLPAVLIMVIRMIFNIQTAQRVKRAG